MLRLAMPVLLEQLLAMLIGFSDTVLTGHYLSESHLAAMNLMAYVLWLSHGIFAVVAIGATAMVARFVGAGKTKAASKVTNQAFLIGVVVAIVATLLGIWLAGRAVLLLQLDGQAAQLATRYVNYILPVLPLVMVEAVGIACLRGAGDMVTGLVVMSIVNVVNVLVSWSLMLGLGPLPKLGWDGIAIGTVAGYVVGGALVLGLLASGRRGLRFHWRWLRPDWSLIRRLLRIGLPGGVDMLSLIGCQFWFVSLINQLGDLAAAAHGVAIRIESLAFLPGVAFQMAAATLCGQYLGAKNYHKASRVVLMACLVGGGVMAAVGVLFLTCADSLTSLAVGASQLHVARAAAPLLKIISLAMPALALTMILSGALRGAGDTRWPLLSTMIGFLVVRLPGAYWVAFDTLAIPGTSIVLTGWGLGLVGAWYVMVIDLWIRALLIGFRFLHGGWKQIKV